MALAERLLVAAPSATQRVRRRDAVGRPVVLGEVAGAGEPPAVADGGDGCAVAGLAWSSSWRAWSRRTRRRWEDLARMELGFGPGRVAQKRNSLSEGEAIERWQLASSRFPHAPSRREAAALLWSPVIDLRLSDSDVRVEITGFAAFLLDVRSLWRGLRWELAVPIEHVVAVKSPGIDPRKTSLGWRTRNVPARQSRHAKPNDGWNGHLTCVRRGRRPTIDLKLADEPYEMVSLSVPDAQAKARAIRDAVRRIRPASLAMVDDWNRAAGEIARGYLQEGKISEERFEELRQEARVIGLEHLHEEGELDDEEYARLKRELSESADPPT